MFNEKLGAHVQLSFLCATVDCDLHLNAARTRCLCQRSLLLVTWRQQLANRWRPSFLFIRRFSRIKQVLLRPRHFPFLYLTHKLFNRHLLTKLKFIIPPSGYPPWRRAQSLLQINHVLLDCRSLEMYALFERIQTVCFRYTQCFGLLSLLIYVENGLLFVVFFLLLKHE